MIGHIEYAGDLHWLELEEPIDIVWIVVQDWYIIQEDRKSTRLNSSH